MQQRVSCGGVQERKKAERRASPPARRPPIAIIHTYSPSPCGIPIRRQVRMMGAFALSFLAAVRFRPPPSQ